MFLGMDYALIGRAPTLLCSHWSRSGQSITLYVLSFCMRPNTATSYSFAFAFASTTLSIIVKCMQFTQVLIVLYDYLIQSQVSPVPPLLYVDGGTGERAETTSHQSA